MAGVWYRAGTVSVTNASKKVVGSGTLFKTTTFKPDKGHAFYGPDGKPYEIDYVESDTVLYLVKAYTGGTASDQSYEIDITRTSTIPALSREISAQLAYAQGQYDSWQQILTGAGDVTLTAPDARQVTVPALANMLSKSGNLAGLADKQAARGNLGLGNAAVRATQTSQIDTDTAHLMLAGAFGLGAIALPRVYDANTLLANGWYSYHRDEGDVNGPPDEPYGTVLYTGNPSNGTNFPGWHYQIFLSINGDMYVRNSAVGTFYAKTWRRVWSELSFPNTRGSWAGYVNGVSTVATVDCSYVRHGNMVHIRGYISFVGVTVPANDGILRGIPFIPAAISPTSYIPCSLYRAGVSNPNINAYMKAGDGSIFMNTTNYLNYPFESGAEYIFGCTYETA